VLHINTAPKGFDTESFIRVLCERLCVAQVGASPVPAESPGPDAPPPETRRVQQLRKWAELSKATGRTWKSATGVEVMFGPMYPGADAVNGRDPEDTSSAKKTQPRTRNTQNKNNEPLEKTKADDASDIAGPEEQALTGRLVDLVARCLAHATANGPVELWRFVINPDSFVQSVENLFYVSFLVKDGQASIENQDGTLFICLLLLHVSLHLIGADYLFHILDFMCLFAFARCC